MPRQHYFWHFLLNLTKVILLRHDFFLDFRCVCCYKVTVLYLYLVVWGVTDWAFSILGSYCLHTVILCHFPCFLAQLSPPATIRLSYDSLIERFLTETFPYNRQFNFECADSRSNHMFVHQKNIKQTASDVLPKFNQKIVLKTLALIFS